MLLSEASSPDLEQRKSVIERLAADLQKKKELLRKLKRLMQDLIEEMLQNN